MFAYCGNNPVMYSDPSGNYSRSMGADIREAHVDSPGLRWNALAELQRQGENKPIVLDISGSYQVSGMPFYIKGGATLLMDFENCEMDFYLHGGGGLGYSSGIGVSGGIVSNYNEPTDYAGVFFDVNGAYFLGFDHCWNPNVPYEKATNATSLTFSIGISGGFGIDLYTRPFEIANWR